MPRLPLSLSLSLSLRLSRSQSIFSWRNRIKREGKSTDESLRFAKDEGKYKIIGGQARWLKGMNKFAILKEKNKISYRKYNITESSNKRKSVIFVLYNLIRQKPANHIKQLVTFSLDLSICAVRINVYKVVLFIKYHLDFDGNTCFACSRIQ